MNKPSRPPSHAKVAVVFVWTRLQPVFGLPGEQDKLVEEVAAVNPNTVVVLNTSQPVALPWVGQGEGHSRDVVAGRRRRMVDGQPAARQSEPRGPAARHLGQEPGRLSRHRSQASRALQEDRPTRKRTYSEGVQRRLSLVRQGKHRAALRLRARPELHQLRLLGPQGGQSAPTADST